MGIHEKISDVYFSLNNTKNPKKNCHQQLSKKIGYQTFVFN